jgi:hypothetical protein
MEESYDDSSLDRSEARGVQSSRQSTRFQDVERQMWHKAMGLRGLNQFVLRWWFDLRVSVRRTS